MQKLILFLAITLIVSQAYAQTCSAGQYSNGTACVACGVGAATCTGANVYQSCKSGFYQTALTGTNVGCTACSHELVHLDDITCSSGIVHLTCYNGFYLSGSTCVKCFAQNAAACASTCTSSGFYSSGSTCLACQSLTSACNAACGSQGFVSVGTTCVSCPTGASTCSSLTIATACSTGYYLSAGAVCKQCPSGQSSCSTSSVATSCSSGYFLSATNVCTICAASTTAACNAACTSSGFYTSGSTCVACATSTTAACNSACVNQGFLTTTTTANSVTTSQCVACAAGAASCSTASVATVCRSTFFLAQAGVCTACSSVVSGNQVTCRDQPNPLTCNLGFGLVDTTCTACGSTSAACTTNCLTQGFYTVNKTCVACGAGAQSCTDNTNSTTCITGFYLSGIVCLPVTTGTVATSAPVSTTPLDNYYIANGVALICADGAKTCDATGALTCLTGYSSVNQKTCVKCPTGASSCTVPQAISCASGYHLSGSGHCAKCNNDGLVDSCFNSQAGSAIGCKSGNFLSAGACTACTGNALQCIKADTHTVCKSDTTNSYFVAIPYTTATCGQTDVVAQAAVFSQFAVKIASACLPGYFIASANAVTTTCVSCGANAIECTSATVIKTCNTGFVLSNNLCNACLNGKTCAADKFTIQTVTGCATGFYVSSTTTCSDCKTSLTTSTGGSLALAAQITACTSKTGAGNTNKVASITCAAGYVAYKAAAGNAAASLTDDATLGCVACAATNIAWYTTCTVDMSGASPAITVPVCATGYYISSASACGDCKSNTFTNSAGAALVLPAQIINCKSKTSAGDLNKVAEITCAAGYVAYKAAAGNAAAKLTDDGTLGCVACTATAAQIAWYTTCTVDMSGASPAITVPVCATGYYISSASACGDCKSNTFTNSAGAALVLPAQIINCKSKTSAGDLNKVAEITCAAGYVAYKAAAAQATAKLTDDATLGCVACAATNIAWYTTCTVDMSTPATPVYTLPICATGYYISSATACGDCKATLTNSAGTALINKELIVSCISKTSAGDLNKVASITCPAGYVAIKASTQTTAVTLADDGALGCVSCTGSATVAGYTSCTADNNYKADGTGGRITAAVCASGYVLVGAAGINCQQCSTQATNSNACTMTWANSVCKSNWFLDSTTGLCAQCGTGAETCTSNTVALTCQETYVFNAVTKVCSFCDATDNASTKTCSPSSSYAAGCSSGFQLHHGQCFACPTNATACTTGPIPTTCNEGYFVSVGTCAQCTGTGAKTCSSAAVTLTCKDSFFSTNTNGVISCTACENAFTTTCTSATVATACVTNYYLATTGSAVKCTQCTTGVATCTATGASTCQDGFYLTTTTCTACPQGVKTCTGAGTLAAGLATGCLSGFYLSSANCYACGLNVASCTSYTAITTCNSGYSLVGTSCIVCPSGATACTATNVATTCRTGFALSNGFCLACSSNTATCGSSYYATTCAAGFFLASGACSSCGTGANVCATASTATSCLTGYYGPSAAGACTVCTTGAAACSDATTHTTCSDGYSKIGAATTCAQCTATGAKACTASASVPTDCLTGYSKITTNAVDSCVKCPDNASSCTSATAVSGCNTGFVAVGGTSCVKCLVGTSACNAPVSTSCSTGYQLDSGVCKQCSSTTYACPTLCASNGFYTPAGTTTCVACGTGALTCSSTAAQTCADGFYGPANNACVACSAGAKTCTATAITACLTTGFFQATTNSVVSCTACGTGALTCASATTASSCLTGYYLDATSVCKSCTNSNAVTCQIQGFALTCKLGFYVSNGVCNACADSASACKSDCLNLGFFTQTTTANNVTTSTCVACGTGAASCSSATIATSCLTGNFLNGQSTCTACASNTDLCPLSSTPAIGGCSVGFLRVSTPTDSCVACPANFATCSNSTTGIDCRDGFYLSSGSCVACPAGAALCQSATAFTLCANTFYPTAQGGNVVTCTACPTANNVVNCWNATYATSCKDGFYAVNGTCSSCPSNAQSCLGTLIVNCLPGFYIFNNTCVACGTGAQTCSSNTTALTCLAGYGLNNGVCTQCASGASACTLTAATACFSTFTLNNGVCSCAAGQVASGNACVSCSDKNCNTCSSANTCTACNSPYQLTNGVCSITCAANQYLDAALSQCASCPTNCATCSSGTVCATCNSGFSLRTSDNSCQANFAGKLQIGNVIMMIALFLGFAFINKL